MDITTESLVGCVFYAPLWKRDAANAQKFMSDDAYGHLCTVTGALWTPQGRLFDGTDDVITVPDHNALDITTAVTLELWINPDVIKASHLVLAKRAEAGTVANYSIWLASDEILVQFYTGTAWADHTTTTADLVAGIWYHIVVIIDCVNDRVSIYKNGISIYNVAETKNMVANTANLTIGGWLTYFFDGRISLTRIYNRTLTPQEIQNNYIQTRWRYR